MKQRKIEVFFLFVLGLFFLFQSGKKIKEHFDTSLSKSKQITGVVTFASPVWLWVQGYSPNSKKRFYAFNLDNSEENFAILRDDEYYTEIKAGIRVGDTVRVYYMPSSEKHNFKVYQVNKGERVIASFEDYYQQESGNAGMFIFFTLVLTIGSVLWYRKFNLVKFLNGFVDGKKQPTGEIDRYK
jgi:hypothetical protein